MKTRLARPGIFRVAVLTFLAMLFDNDMAMFIPYKKKYVYCITAIS